MSDRPTVDGDREVLVRLVGELIGELDALHQRIVQIDRLAEALLARDEMAVFDEPSRRALQALRRVAAAYGQAYDATRDDAPGASGDLTGHDRSA